MVLKSFVKFNLDKIGFFRIKQKYYPVFGNHLGGDSVDKSPFRFL